MTAFDRSGHSEIAPSFGLLRALHRLLFDLRPTVPEGNDAVDDGRIGRVMFAVRREVTQALELYGRVHGQLGQRRL